MCDRPAYYASIILSIKHNASIIGYCKINVNSKIKDLWKIVVNDLYALIEQSLYDKA